MLENILPYEEYLLYLINHTHIYFLDCFMWLVSKTQVWIPLFILLLFLLIYKKSYKDWLPILIVIALVFLFCDQFSSGICKPYFSRLRPTHHPDFMNEVRVLHGYRGGKHGFISGHAANAFGFATITALLFRNKMYAFAIYGFAFMIAYSRVYLGVHFISDILAGSISGIIIGVIMYLIYRLYTKNRISVVLSTYRTKSLSISMIIYIFILLLYSALRLIIV